MIEKSKKTEELSKMMKTIDSIDSDGIRAVILLLKSNEDMLEELIAYLKELSNFDYLDVCTKALEIRKRSDKNAENVV